MYTVRPDIPQQSLLIPHPMPNGSPSVVWPSAVFEMENGDLVAAAFFSKRTPSNTLSCRITAWLVDAQGDAQAPAGTNEPIYVDFKHNAPLHQLEQLGIAGLAAAMRDLIFGEPAPEAPLLPPIPWPDEVRGQCNIRSAIAIARATGETVDLVAAVGTPVMFEPGFEGGHQEYDLDGLPKPSV